MNDSTPRRLQLIHCYPDGDGARHFGFRIAPPVAGDLDVIPGQFFMLALPGYGEAPFTYVSLPDRNGYFSALIHRVGRLAEALFEQAEGAVLGYRGPFGKGWPLFLGTRRVLAVAGGGGLAPLAGMIDEVLLHRLPLQLSVIYGARHADAQILHRQRAEWRRRLPLLETLEVAAEGVRQGSLLLPLDECFAASPPDVVLCCGPEPLMLATAEVCRRRGLSADRLWLSLERRLSCADGRCGLCRLGSSYVCRDGPTYRYDRFLQLQGRGGSRPDAAGWGFC